MNIFSFEVVFNANCEALYKFEFTQDWVLVKGLETLLAKSKYASFSRVFKHKKEVFRSDVPIDKSVS